jgi:phosphohistidine phosphatase SixA
LGFSEGRGVEGITPVRLAQHAEAALDAAADNERDVTSRSELVGRIVTEWLTANGYLRNAYSDQGLRPDELNSENDG